MSTLPQSHTFASSMPQIRRSHRRCQPRSIKLRRQRCATSSGNTPSMTCSPRRVINTSIRQILDTNTLEWGVEVTLVELKDIHCRKV